MVQEPAEADRPQGARRSPARSPEEKSTSNGRSRGNGRGSRTPARSRVGPPITAPSLGDEGELPGPGNAPAQLEETESPKPLLNPKESKPIDLATVRFRIAVFSMAILAFVVVASFVTLWRTQPSIDNLTRLLEIIFAPLVALAGVAVAFYYRSKPPS
jgi:hypothetical protein